MKTVLVIDDEQMFHALIQRLFVALDVDIVGALRVDEGLRMARELKPSVLIVDIRLPGEDGWVAVESIRNDPELKHTPVIVVTAAGRSHDRKMVSRLNCQGYFQKPFNIQEFRDCVSQYLA